MNKKYRMLAGLYALLLPKLWFSLTDDGGGGGEEKPEENPALKALFGLDAPADDQQQQQPSDDEPVKPGLSLQAAIAEPSDEEKKAADEKAAAEKKAADEKAAAEKREADEKAAAEKRAADEKAAADAATAAIKVRKTKTPAEIAAEEKAKKEAEEKASRETAAAAWESGLLDEEKDQLELARMAERKDPVKYKGLAAKTEKFIRENAAKTEAADFDPDSDDYKAWVAKERPALSNSEVRALERMRGEEIATKKATEESAKVLDQTFRMVEEPRVKQQADAYFAKAASEAMPDDVAKVFREDPKKAAEQFPFEVQIAQAELSAHADVVEEMLALTRKNPATGRTLKAYDAKNAVHQQVLALIGQVETSFKKAGVDTVREGKQFLTREELARVPEADRGRYWTFTSAEIAERSTPLVKARVASKITAEHERLKKLGFERKPAAAATAAPAASAAPAPRAAPVHGGGGGGGAESATDRLLRESGMVPEK